MISRQVRRAQERFRAKVEANAERVEARRGVRKTKKLTPLSNTQAGPYPKAFYVGFEPRWKDYRRAPNYGRQEAARRSGRPF